MEWYRKNFKAGEANNSTPFEANSLARSSVLMSIFSLATDVLCR